MRPPTSQDFKDMGDCVVARLSLGLLRAWDLLCESMPE